MIKNSICAIVSIILSCSAVFFFHPIKNVPLLLLILLSIVLFLVIRTALPFWNEVRIFSQSKKISFLIFFVLFPLFVVVSVKGEQLYLLDNHLLVVGSVYLGFFATIVIIVAALIRIMLKVQLPSGEKKVAWWNLVLYCIPFLVVSIFFLVAFYPAAMTPDSLAQWEQSKTREFTNWHPVVYTWVIMALTFIWNSPAIVAIFQIVLLALASGFLGYTLERFLFPRKFIWLGLVLLALSPVNAIYSITIWKDVVYSAFMLLFSIIIFILVKTAGKETRNLSFLIMFVLISLGLVFFRHNGFPVFVVTMIMTIIMYKTYWKRLITVTLLIIAVHQLVTGPLYTKMEVIPSDPQEALSIPTQQIAAIVTGEGNLTDSQRQYVNRLMPLPLWEEKYNPYSVDSIKFSWGDYDRFVIYDNPKQYATKWGNMVLANPGLAAEGLFNQTSLVWQMNEPKDGYTSKYVTNIYLNNEFDLKNHILQPTITNLARTYLYKAEELKEIIWRPAVYTTLALLFIYIAYLRNDWRAWLLIFPIALNTGSVFVAIPAQDFRYLFSNSLFMYLAFFISFMTYQKSRQYNEQL